MPRDVARPGRTILDAAGAAIAALTGFALFLSACVGTSTGIAGSGPSATGSVGGISVEAEPSAGRLEIGDDVFVFSPTTCTITAESFIIAGPGETDDGEKFFIEIETPGTVSARFGVSAEDDTPTDGSSWYRTVDPAHLTRSDSTLTGLVVLNDVNGSPDEEMAGALSVTCR